MSARLLDPAERMDQRERALSARWSRHRTTSVETYLSVHRDGEDIELVIAGTYSDADGPSIEDIRVDTEGEPVWTGELTDSEESKVRERITERAWEEQSE